MLEVAVPTQTIEKADKPFNSLPDQLRVRLEPVRLRIDGNLIAPGEILIGKILNRNDPPQKVKMRLASSEQVFAFHGGASVLWQGLGALEFPSLHQLDAMLVLQRRFSDISGRVNRHYVSKKSRRHK